MKPTSIIFTIVSIALMLAGLLICAIAGAQAERTGIDIFNSALSDSGDMVFDYDFSDDNIRKISVEVLDADVNLLMTDGAPHIELINFSDGTYTFSHTNKLISVTNNANIFSMLQFGTGNFSFDGLRHYFHGTINRDAKKVVNIYLNPENELKTISLALQSGSLSVTGARSACDYLLSVSGGDALLSDLSGAGSIQFTGTSCDLTLREVSCASLTSSQHNGSLSSENLTISDKLSAETDSGSISLDLVRTLDQFKASLNSVRGMVTVYGNNYEYGYNDGTENTTDINFSVKVNTGDIVIT